MKDIHAAALVFIIPITWIFLLTWIMYSVIPARYCMLYETKVRPEYIHSLHRTVNVERKVCVAWSQFKKE